MTSDLLSHLREVAASTTPAQACEARALLEILSTTPDDARAQESARLLVDAYLNDPYLTR